MKVKINSGLMFDVAFLLVIVLSLTTNGCVKREKTSAKKVIKAIESKEEKDLQKIDELFKDFVKRIDTASGKGIVHSNKAARHKSRMAKKINLLSQQK